MKIIILFTIILLCFKPTISIGQSFSQYEIEEIIKKVKDKRIIGLGEAEHFYKGYYNTKIELIKQLINHNLIDVIAIEGSINVTKQLNDYIQGACLRNINMTLAALNEPYALQKAGLFNAIEIKDMIDWLRVYNLNNTKKIKLIGIDFQNYSMPLQILQEQSNTQQKKLITETKSLLDSSMQAILDSNIMIIISKRWLNRLQIAKKNIKVLKLEMSQASNKEIFHELEQFTNLWDDPMIPRDSFMYENLAKYINYKDRILLWAHNFHIDNDYHFKGPKKLGIHLTEKHTEDYYSIAVSDLTKSNTEKLILPNSDLEIKKYDLIINTHKGEKCDILYF